MMYFYYSFFSYNFILFFFDANILLKVIKYIYIISIIHLAIIGLNKRILNKFKL